jgi:hypothetical protein
MITAAFFIIWLLGTGFLTVFLVALCKDSRRHRTCKAVEHLLGADYEIGLDRSHSRAARHLTRLHPIPIEQSIRKIQTTKTLGTGTPGAAD